MFAPTLGAPATEPTTGLVRSAITPDDGTRWQGGLAWRQERCFSGEGFDPCGDEFTAAGGELDDSLVYYRPVAFRVFDECSTRGGRSTDPDRVRRQALAATSWFVARELETGALSQANPYVTPDDPSAVNAYLQQATGGQVLAGTHLPQVALGLIEEAARDAQLGGDPWIHIPVRLVPLLGDVLTQAGGLLTTKTGARVVADSGYSGDGPEEATGTWLYATGPVQVRLSAIDTTEYVDHETNVITRTASRLFAATFDPCTLHAVQISVPEPAA